MSETALNLAPDLNSFPAAESPQAEARPRLVPLKDASGETAESGQSSFELQARGDELRLFPRESVKKTPWLPVHRVSAVSVIIAALSLIAVVEFVVLLSRPGYAVEDPISPTSRVAIESVPAGATIAIDNHTQGVTPSTVLLNPGEYRLSLMSGGITRNITMVVRAGIDNTERIYFDSDGESSIVDQTPHASAIPVATVAAPLPPAGAVGGWLSVNAPIELQLFEKGALIGSSQTERVMLPVGRHVIDLVNPTLGYRTSSTVQVSPGVVIQLKPEIPNGTLNINAVPWAEVVLDGKRLGPTPIGNVSLAIGTHDVVFTHPELGERRQAVVVTLNGQNRASVNLNQR